MPTRLALGFILAASLTSAAYAQDGVRVYALPDAAAYPEGIAADASGKTIYSTNVATGAVFAVDVASGAVKQVAEPLGVAPGQEARAPALSLGSKVDSKNRLWVAGGETGTMHVIDLKTGRKLAKFTTAGMPGFINDVVISKKAAYFTDTRRPFLWKVTTKQLQDAVVEPWISFDGTPLAYTSGANLNGIAATKNGRYLIVVQMAAGKLFRIDTKTKAVVQIDTGAEVLTMGDGLVLDGSRLYLVRQGAGEVVALDLSKDLLTAKVVKRITPPELAWPATAALAGDRLIVANSQLNKRGSNTPARPFSLVAIPVSAFAK